LKEEQGYTLVLIGFIFPGDSLVSPVGGDLVLLGNGVLDSKGEFRILAEKNLEKLLVSAIILKYQAVIDTL
jgi:hypothetical protein